MFITLQQKLQKLILPVHFELALGKVFLIIKLSFYKVTCQSIEKYI